MRYFIDSLNHNLFLTQKESKGNNKLPRKIVIWLRSKDQRKKLNKGNLKTIPAQMTCYTHVSFSVLTL